MLIEDERFSSKREIRKNWLVLLVGGGKLQNMRRMSIKSN